MFERIKHHFKCWYDSISFLYFSRNFTLLFLILFSLLLMPFESSVELRCQDIYIYVWDQYHHSAYKTGRFDSCFLISWGLPMYFLISPSLKHVVRCFATILKDQKWKNKKVPLFLQAKLFFFFNIKWRVKNCHGDMQMFERIKHHSSADIIPNFIFIFPW